MRVDAGEVFAGSGLTSLMSFPRKGQAGALNPLALLRALLIQHLFHPLLIHWGDHPRHAAASCLGV